MLYKGYVKTKGKRSLEKLKGASYHTLEEAREFDSYGGVLADDVILIDIDDNAQSEIMMNIVEDQQLNCRVYQTSRGRHFLFKNHQVTSNRTHCQLAIGLMADIKIGLKTSYEVIKIDGEERFIEWDIEEGAHYQEVPLYFLPIRSSVDFSSMSEGDGRNQALFNYILTLQGNGYDVEQSRSIIRMINKFVLKEPLPNDELEVILRDESFQKPVFFNDKTFLFDTFARYLVSNEHIVRINNQLHIYRDGLYVADYKAIETAMINLIPQLKQSQRKEVLAYIELIATEMEPADARYIGFTNGIYDILTDTIIPFAANIILTNRLPWEFNRSAYSEVADTTLNKLACGDISIRALLEECIGYTFYRRNELGKAFILTGDKSNGKSTFLSVVKSVLGDENISALDLRELGDRFSTSMMFGKLANIGDDIGDDFLMGGQVAIFKKIVTGDRIKAERKGQDPFEFNPYVKMLFAANDIPRMKDKTGAVLRRLVIVPFNASFSKDDPDYRPFIKYELQEREAVEYFIKIGIEGLKRVLINQGFTQSEKVSDQLNEYEEENNPLIAFIADQGADEIINESTSDVYKRYQVFCADNAMTPMSKIVFSKQINKRLGTEIFVTRIDNKTRRIFRKKEGTN